jgi:hypothetical protein
MAAAVARQESHLAPGQRSHHEVSGGHAERRVENRLLLRRKARHGVQPAAADDSDFRFHVIISSKTSALTSTTSVDG